MILQSSRRRLVPHDTEECLVPLRSKGLDINALSFESFFARSAALRPSKPKPGLLGAAARESPPRHAKRVSGAPGLRRKEMFWLQPVWRD
jgi:hypothetical protein